MRSIAFARASFVFAAAVSMSVPALAQEKKPAAPPMTQEQQAQMDAMMKSMTPGAPHQRLAELSGEWTFTNKMWMDPSAPPTESTGTATNKMILGGRYLQTDQRGVFAGMPFEGIGTMAFDNVTQKYYSTWIDNMGTALAYSTGTYDPSKRAYSWVGDMPDPTKPGTPLRFREVLTVVDANTHRIDWYQTQGGKEVKTMEIVYKRKK